jgi:hypothetical protein
MSDFGAGSQRPISFENSELIGIWEDGWLEAADATTKKDQEHHKDRFIQEKRSGHNFERADGRFRDFSDGFFSGAVRVKMMRRSPQTLPQTGG